MKKNNMISELSHFIFTIRGQKVMLDSDLANLYSVPTKRLNEAVKRNVSRFPADFMFQLSVEESSSLRSQFATLKKSRGSHKKYCPYVFTEQGVAMLSSVLKSETAIEVNIQIMRIFVEIRRHALNVRDLKLKVDEIENKYDSQFKVVFDALRKLLASEVNKKSKQKMGF